MDKEKVKVLAGKVKGAAVKITTNKKLVIAFFLYVVLPLLLFVLVPALV